MDRMRELMRNNRDWVSAMTKADPNFFENMVHKQEPDILFIGCSDSRVPESTITGSKPGEMFVHRNIANQVFPNDLNLLSVLQYAVEVLDVGHIIVCGHDNCGGVHAGMGTTEYGIVDNWLARIRELSQVHKAELDTSPQEQRLYRMVCLNVVQQIAHLSRIPLIQSAWRRGKRPLLHGLVYDLKNGLLQPVVTGIDGTEKAAILNDRFRVVEAALAGRPFYDSFKDGPPAQLPVATNGEGTVEPA